METIKIQIIKWLEGEGSWQFGGKLCRVIHDQSGHKESVIERRCRELENAGVIEKSLAQVNGEGPKCVRYRIVEIAPAYIEAKSEEYNLKLI